MKNIDFNNECWICGVKESYNVCPSCGVEIYLIDNGKTGTNKIIQYLKDTDINRFNKMIEQSKKKIRNEKK